MLAPHAVDIAVINSSLIASPCFTFAEPFDDIFLFVKSSCALVSGNTNKSLRPKEGRNECPIDQASLSYFAFCKIVVKIALNSILGLESQKPALMSQVGGRVGTYRSLPFLSANRWSLDPVSQGQKGNSY